MKKVIVLIALCCIIMFAVYAQTSIKLNTSKSGFEYPQYIDADDLFSYATVLTYHPAEKDQKGYILLYILLNPHAPYGQLTCADFGNALIINNGYSKVKLSYDKEYSEEMTQAESNTTGKDLFFYKTEDVETALKVLGSGYSFTITGTKYSLSDWRFPEITSFIDLCELVM